MYNPPKPISRKSGLMTKPNILVKNKRRNESSDNASNISNSSNRVCKNFPKPSGSLSNKSKNSFTAKEGPFKNLNISNDQEPLISTSSRRRVDSEYEESHSRQENMNCINVAIDPKEKKSTNNKEWIEKVSGDF
jgi:hypothetical protein